MLQDKYPDLKILVEMKQMVHLKIQINEQANPVLAENPEDKEWADWKTNAEYEIGLREKTLKRQREDIDTEFWGVPFQKRQKTAAVRDENMHWMHDVLSVVEVTVKRKMKELEAREKKLEEEEKEAKARNQRRVGKKVLAIPQQPPSRRSRRQLSAPPPLPPPPPAMLSVANTMPSGTKRMVQELKEWIGDTDAREIPAPPAFPEITEEEAGGNDDEAGELQASAPALVVTPDAADVGDQELSEEDIKPEDEDCEDDDDDDDDDDEADDDEYEEPESNETKASEQNW